MRGEVASYHAGPIAGAATEWVAREVLTNPTVAGIYANTYLPSDERGERFLNGLQTTRMTEGAARAHTPNCNLICNTVMWPVG
jgi:hypothetical protein